jgi:ABC-2 type transport system permease protein
VVAGVRLYLAVAAMAYQRRLAYRTANLAGLFTNAVFGYLRTAVFLALFQAQPVVAGYTAQEMITFSWLMQAMIMVVQLWGWFEVEETIRTGDVVSDLARPFSYLGYWLAQDLGRAAYFVLYRGVPVVALGYLTMGMALPGSPLTWLAFLLSLTLATAINFAWRFTLNLTAFWTTDARGVANLGMGFMSAVSGFLVPLSFFPAPLGAVLAVLPFAGIIQTPADVFMERVTGTGLLLALGQQALWAAVMLLGAQAVVVAATRRLVVQGG